MSLSKNKKIRSKVDNWYYRLKAISRQPLGKYFYCCMQIADDFYDLFDTDPSNGLSSERAAEILDYYGPNTLTPATQNGWLKILLKSMCTGFSILIWLGALLCVVAYLIEASAKPNPCKDNLFLGCVLIAVDVICGLFSFFQNYKSSKVDNSSLTGESVAVPRCNTEGTANMLESPNVAFFSTQCVEGWALGIVICCGDLTALGRVAGLATRLQPEPSPLSREISHFMRCMSIFALCLGVFIAGASLALGYPFMQTTIFVIGIIVANIPEGLQPTVTASLTLTAQRMVKNNCLIKNLDAIEALGACTTICSDKTGTLTENKMCVYNLWTWNKIYSKTQPEFEGVLHSNQAFADLMRCGALCSTATLNADGSVRGDASETAILNFVSEYDDVSAMRSEFPKVAEIPFNSVIKYQASVHLDTKLSRFIVMMKGAPENIISRCDTVAFGKKTIVLTKEMKDAVDKAAVNMAKSGQRILAFADLVLDQRKFPLNYEFNADDANFPLDNLRLLGVMGLMDPPRSEVRSAILRVREAGVRVMMVTGDHPATALAVAGAVGIATSPRCHVITGAELRSMTPDLLDRTLDKYYEIVFARTSPTQKLQIVEACQRSGGVVAVTGDGVNDAPALRRADIGISMGITGSQVSKQTADIILMDDNFATIVTGIEEGRKIFDNLKKSICYILISNVPEIVPVLIFILFSIPLPLGVMTILCVDLGTDMWPAVSLAYEEAESNVMARRPRGKDPLVSGRMVRLAYGHLGLVETAAGLTAYFIVMAEHGFYPPILFGIRERWDNPAVSDLQDSLGQEWTYTERAEVLRASQAAYFVAVVITQMMNGVICKTRYNSLYHVGMKNRVLNLGLVFEIIIACIVCYCPGINSFFRAYPLRIQWWFLAVPFAVFMFFFDEFRKYCIRRELFGGFYNILTYY
ncbi:hypothetical protein MSG28_005148 [Choristoneura fumiferana]|uniref:Uncharacterized protein n=1 Tax=Choristoneura fumiferana TaxID=7141 RepID=A0ACC0JQ21_CHOFU|nr:hypothetical protein MSG28_005148 [Choristoneura fumiferana]